MSVRKDLLKEIERKVQKIRNKRLDMASTKDIESLVFDFFKTMEEVYRIASSKEELVVLAYAAHENLLFKIKPFDSGLKHDHIVINWRGDGQVQGVTINWTAL